VIDLYGRVGKGTPVVGLCQPCPALMEAHWVTYRQAAEQLGCSVESVRVRAIRNRWPRQMGNDKRARIQIPEGVTSVQRTPGATPDDSVVKALQAHVDTRRSLTKSMQW
jgi:phosphoribosylformylglycinamidine (FGAM) synthase-like amidotransferase family enzyme